jgi:hypothetical protein
VSTSAVVVGGFSKVTELVVVVPFTNCLMWCRRPAIRACARYRCRFGSMPSALA